MINVKDRIPTLANRVKITHSDETVEYVLLERADEPTEVGTPINKALFDSIDLDIQAKLPTANKATDAEVKAGTNDTKYVTPSKLQTKITTLTSTASETHSGSTATNYTLVNFSNVGNQKITICAKIIPSTSSNYATVTLAGTGITFKSTIDDGSGFSATSVPLNFRTSTTQMMQLTIDNYSKTITGILYRLPSSTGSPSIETVIGHYTTLTSITATLRATSSIDYSVSYSSKNPNA